MREERVEVLGLHHLRGALERCVGVAVVVQLHGWSLLGQFLRPSRKANASVGGRWAFVPRDLQLLPRGLRLPPVVRHDGHAAVQTDAHAAGGIASREIRPAFDDERVADAG